MTETRGPVGDDDAASELEAAERHDQNVFTLRRVARQQPEAARAAGERVWEQATLAAKNLNKKKRQTREDVLSRMEAARRFAVDPGSEGPENTQDQEKTEGPEKTQDLEPILTLVLEFKRGGGDLQETTAKDAVLSALVERQMAINRSIEAAARLARGDSEDGKRQEEPAEEVRERIQRVWIPSAKNEVAQPAFLIAKELRHAIDEPPDAVRTLDRWWELAVSILLVEVPEVDLPKIGMGAGLEWKDDLPAWAGAFEQRRLMRTYLETQPYLDEQREREFRARYRALAGRAARNLESSGVQVEHAEDFTWLTVEGEHYQFSKGNQAGVIRVLYENWVRSGGRDGAGLTEEAISEAIGSGSVKFRIQETFRQHPALGTILRPAGRGIYALFLRDRDEGS